MVKKVNKMWRWLRLNVRHSKQVFRLSENPEVDSVELSCNCLFFLFAYFEYSIWLLGGIWIDSCCLEATGRWGTLTLKIHTSWSMRLCFVQLQSLHSYHFSFIFVFQGAFVWRLPSSLSYSLSYLLVWFPQRVTNRRFCRHRGNIWTLISDTESNC